MSSVGRAGGVLALVAAVLLGAACSPQDGKAGEPAASPTIDPQLGVDPGQPVDRGNLPEPGPISLDDLPSADRGLTLGAEHVSGANHTTVLEVTRPMVAPQGVPSPGRGQEWVGVRARTCFESDLARQLEIGSYLLSVVSDDGIRYPGVQPEQASWPLPQYPAFGRLAPGQCSAGWIAVPVPESAVLTGIVQTSVDTRPVAEWDYPAGS